MIDNTWKLFNKINICFLLPHKNKFTSVCDMIFTMKGAMIEGDVPLTKKTI